MSIVIGAVYDKVMVRSVVSMEIGLFWFSSYLCIISITSYLSEIGMAMVRVHKFTALKDGSVCLNCFCVCVLAKPMTIILIFLALESQIVICLDCFSLGARLFALFNVNDNVIYTFTWLVF